MLKPPQFKPRVIDAARVVLICRSNYGLTVRQAARALCVSEGAARRALRSLERGCMARTERVGRRIVYYSAERALLDWVWS